MKDCYILDQSVSVTLWMYVNEHEKEPKIFLASIKKKLVSLMIWKKNSKNIHFYINILYSCF